MQKRIRNKQLASINVVPYIDVMLVLLVIFMVTAPLLSQGVKVDLPRAAAQPLATEAPEPIIVSIDAQGNYFLNVAARPDQPLSPQTLAQQVMQQLTNAQPQTSNNASNITSSAARSATATKPQPQRQILVKGDKHVDYGKVVEAMVILKNAGADNVGLMTQYDEATH
jgi:biopolymer transport protein TolR